MLRGQYSVLRNNLQHLFLLKDPETQLFFRSPQFSSDFSISFRKRVFPKVLRLSSGSRFLNGWIDHNYKFIIFCSPKVGTTSLEFVARAINEKFILKNGFIPIESTYSAAEANRNINWKNYYSYLKYLPIRSPFERYISFFEDKIMSPFEKTRFYGFVEAKKSFLLNMAYFGDSKELNDFGEMTFAKSVFQLERYAKDKSTVLWDTHLHKQITNDFKEIALKETSVFNSNELSQFILNWMNCYGLDESPVHLNKFKIEDKYINDASKLSLKQISKMTIKPNKSSYFDHQLVEIIEDLYKIDTIAFNQHKHNNPPKF